MTEVSKEIDMPDFAFPYVSQKLGDYDFVTSFNYDWEIVRGRDNMWVSSLSSTSWYMLALCAFNPFGFDKENGRYKLFD
jgi:hypothetical protein